MKLWALRVIALILISMGAAGMTFMLSTRLLNEGPHIKLWRADMKRELLLAGEMTAEWLVTHKGSAPDRLLQHVVGAGSAIRLYDRSMNELTSTGDSEGLGEIAQQALTENQFVIAAPPPPMVAEVERITMAAPFTTFDGKQVIVAMGVRPDSVAPRPSVMWRYGLRIGSLCVGILVLFLLIRYTERPAREVRRALNLFSRGELDVRLGENVTGNNDELARLARDFNTMAENLSELHNEQRRLFGEISHEMRTPLSRMALAVELAGNGNNGDNAKLLDRIRQDATRLGVLTNQMLDLARMQRKEEQAKPVNITGLVKSICDECSFEAAPANRRILFVGTCGELTVAGCEESLRRMVENVIRNGIRHTPENTTVTATVDTTFHTGKQYALIRVADNGKGVAEEHLGKIFRPFMRASGAAMEGAGLGLSITRHVAISHGGNVWAENRKEGGLQIAIRIPLLQAQLFQAQLLRGDLLGYLESETVFSGVISPFRKPVRQSEHGCTPASAAYRHVCSATEGLERSNESDGSPSSNRGVGTAMDDISTQTG